MLVYFKPFLVRYEDIKKVVRYLSHIHLNDERCGKGVWEFPALDSGEVDFETPLQMVSDHCFSGLISVEIEVISKDEISVCLFLKNSITADS